MLAEMLEAEKDMVGILEAEWLQNIKNVTDNVDMWDLWYEAKNARAKALGIYGL